MSGSVRFPGGANSCRGGRSHREESSIIRASQGGEDIVYWLEDGVAIQVEGAEKTHKRIPIEACSTDNVGEPVFGIARCYPESMVPSQMSHCATI
jgi:hypothetical protein